MKLLIGNKNLSSWSMRPWLLMRHAGIAFEEQVMLFEASDWREKIVGLSPSRRVPVLFDGDLAVWESLAIMEHLADRFPEKKLWPDDLGDRARARSLSCEMHAGFAAMRNELSLDVAARHPRPTLSAEAEAEVARVLEIWSEARGPFLFGAFTIADAMFAPVVWRFRTYDISVTHPTARAWFETMQALPAMKQWDVEAKAEPRASSISTGSAQHAFAVIFSSKLQNADGYEETAARMVELASAQPGFLGVESARGANGFGITVSYWESRAAIRRWKAQAEHMRAQARGRESFYARYELRVCSVERAYRFP